MIAAAAADGAGSHTVAFYALLLAVPAAAVAALEAFGRVLDGANEQLHALLWAVVLALVVVGCAVRAAAVADGAVPGLARSALLACLGVFCVQAAASAARELRDR
ncbi:MAG TPA: hypothetical protein VFJ75_06740 [Gaiellaceae bacterium]|nr:hypothetical protein [Gaiellaceae bacterium]